MYVTDLIFFLLCNSFELPFSTEKKNGTEVSRERGWMWAYIHIFLLLLPSIYISIHSYNKENCMGLFNDNGRSPIHILRMGIINTCLPVKKLIWKVGEMDEAYQKGIWMFTIVIYFAIFLTFASRSCLYAKQAQKRKEKKKVKVDL